MDQVQGIGFLGAGSTAYKLAAGYVHGGYRDSAVVTRSFVSASAFTEQIGSG